MAGKEDITRKLTLLENGLDFIARGIDELFDDELRFQGYVEPTERSTRSYKYGVIHLFGGFLLLLKERLARHLPELIYQGSVTQVRARLNGKKIPNTVDFDEALERLEVGPLVSFPVAELKLIKRIQQFRNEFEHYEITINPFQVWGDLSKFVTIIDRFLVEELQVLLENVEDFNDLKHKLQEIEPVATRIIEQEKNNFLQEMREKLALFQENHENIITGLLEQYRFPRDPDSAFVYCPSCYQEEGVIVVGEFNGICRYCEEFYYITDCDLCGKPMAGWEGRWERGGVDWCEDCEVRFEDYMAHD